MGDIIDVIDSIERDTDNKISYHYVVIDYIGEYKNGTLKAASDVSETRWIKANQLQELDIPDRTEKLIRKAYKTKHIFG